MKKSILVSLVLAFCVLQAQAEVRLPAAMASNMVLQQQTEANLWGWAKPNSTVKITTSWNNSSYSTQVKDNGKWITKVATPVAGGPYTITIKDTESSVTLENVLIGEVWVCSGQSNMRMVLRGNVGQPIKGSLENIYGADKYKDRIRFLDMDLVGSTEPQDDLPNGRWLVCNPSNAYSFSATPYFFAKHLTDMLGVPVGIISNSWGGSMIESWIDEPTARSIEGLDVDNINKGKTVASHRRHEILNHMVLPVVNYTAKGFIWSQGESNRFTPELYGREFKAMVALWRKLWGNEHMPFYYAQLAPYAYENKDDIERPIFVEQQLRSLDDVPNSGIIPTSDIGNEACIHPQDKDVSGFRFAIMALKNCYGFAADVNVPSSGPKVVSIDFQDKVVTVKFDVGNGLFAEYGNPKGFMLSGADKKFYPAQAVIKNNPTRVELTCDQVTSPVAVRYGFKNFDSEANLTDAYFLPAFPFRSDDWDDVK